MPLSGEFFGQHGRKAHKTFENQILNLWASRVDNLRNFFLTTTTEMVSLLPAVGRSGLSQLIDFGDLMVSSQ